MAEQEVEQEICGNCKRAIPQHNYVMHTAHCARNKTLCKVCKEVFAKSEFAEHSKSCVVKPKVVKSPEPPKTNLENSPYFQSRKEVEDRKQLEKRERYLERHEKFLNVGNTVGTSSKVTVTNGTGAVKKTQVNKAASPSFQPKAKSGLLPCKFCDLELPKLELEEHENYCGSRTDKCLDCGELVMFKHRQVHLDTNHGFLKLNDEPGPRPSWDSSTQRPTNGASSSPPRRRRFEPRIYTDFSQFDPTDYLPSNYRIPKPKIEKGESYKEISRRLDCKTEYIRNLLHDSASITVPLRHSGTSPRNHFNHNKGPAPQPPASRRKNPPTELCIPCEFCDTPIPHGDLIQHETGCRPDLARVSLGARRRLSSDEDDYYAAPPAGRNEVELPCEFCADMIPESQLLRHQATCG